MLPLFARQSPIRACRWFGLGAAAILAACQQPPARVEGQESNRKQFVNGLPVIVVEPTGATRASPGNLQATQKNADDMKNSAKATTFTPDEQQTGK